MRFRSHAQSRCCYFCVSKSTTYCKGVNLHFYSACLLAFTYWSEQTNHVKIWPNFGSKHLCYFKQVFTLLYSSFFVLCTCHICLFLFMAMFLELISLLLGHISSIDLHLKKVLVKYVHFSVRLFKCKLSFVFHLISFGVFSLHCTFICVFFLFLWFDVTVFVFVFFRTSLPVSCTVCWS